MVNRYRQGGESPGDKAGIRRWADTCQGWESGIFEPHSEGIRFLGCRKRHALFARAFHSYVPPRERLIEVGCGGSKFPPFIDASEVAVSFGLVEHFSDSAKPMAHVVRLLRPGGLIITAVSNYVYCIARLSC